MKLDINVSFVDQINDYLKSINKEIDSLSIRQWNDDEVKNLVDLFLVDINYGQHTENSKLHKILSYDHFAEHILYKKQDLELRLQYSKDIYKDKSILDINNILMRLLFAHYIFKCRMCGEEFYAEYKKGGYIQCHQHEHDIPDGVGKNYKPKKPPNEQCYNNDIVKLKIKMKSNKFVIANDLRHMFKDQSIDFDNNKYDINTPLGRVKCTDDFADKNIMCISTGNTSELIFKNKTGYVFTDMYKPDIEEYDYGEEFKETIRRVNNKISTEKYKLKEEISCSLRWLMGASDCDLNMDACEMYDTVYTFRVKKDDTYILEYDSTINFYKFYKEVVAT